MDKLSIDGKYINQANQLELEFFSVIDEGLLNQHRELKPDKSIDEFNQRHRGIWHNHTAELIAAGFMEAPKPPEPVRDLGKEIDEIKAKIADYDELQAKVESLVKL